MHKCEYIYIYNRDIKSIIYILIHKKRYLIIILIIIVKHNTENQARAIQLVYIKRANEPRTVLFL
jgi:hypothetical protein